MSRKRYFERKIQRFLLRRPAWGMKLADFGARSSWRLHLGDARRKACGPAEWETLLGALTPEEARRYSMEQIAQCRKVLFLEQALKRAEPGTLAGMRRWVHPERITQPLAQGRPVIAAGWHVGPLYGFAFGLMALERPLTLLLHKPVHGLVPEDWEVIATDTGEAGGVVAFRQCTARLRKGGLVAMACDNFAGPETGLPVSVFGIHLYLKRGFAALSTATGAAIVPVSIQWEDGGRLVYEALPPLASADGDRSDREIFETRVVREYGERLDAYMRAFPYDLDPQRVRVFVRAWKREHGEASAGGEGGSGAGVSGEFVRRGIP